MLHDQGGVVRRGYQAAWSASTRQPASRPFCMRTRPKGASEDHSFVGMDPSQLGLPSADFICGLHHAQPHMGGAAEVCHGLCWQVLGRRVSRCWAAQPRVGSVPAIWARADAHGLCRGRVGRLRLEHPLWLSLWELLLRKLRECVQYVCAPPTRLRDSGKTTRDSRTHSPVMSVSRVCHPGATACMPRGHRTDEGANGGCTPHSQVSTVKLSS